MPGSGCAPHEGKVWANGSMLRDGLIHGLRLDAIRGAREREFRMDGRSPLALDRYRMTDAGGTTWHWFDRGSVGRASGRFFFFFSSSSSTCLSPFLGVSEFEVLFFVVLGSEETCEPPLAPLRYSQSLSPPLHEKCSEKKRGVVREPVRNCSLLIVCVGKRSRTYSTVGNRGALAANHPQM